MKKLVLFAAAIVAISFASCTGSSNNAEATQDTTATVTETVETVETVAADTAVVDSAAATTVVAE